MCRQGLRRVAEPSRHNIKLLIKRCGSSRLELPISSRHIWDTTQRRYVRGSDRLVDVVHCRNYTSYSA
nr:hypothetical protein CFP56_70800 [Quercus suber]